MRVASEAEIQNRIMVEHGHYPDVTLYRNNTGVHKSEVVTTAHLERMLSWAVSGKISDQTALLEIASLLRNLLREKPRFTPYGLCKGSSDIIGIVQKPFYENGCCNRGPMGIFLALEVKAEKGRVSVEQQMFLDLVNRRGGVGRVVRSSDDALAAINEARTL